MAIAFASSSASDEFPNLSNLLVLCSAASDAYICDYGSSDTPENKLSNNEEKTVTMSTRVKARVDDCIRYIPINSVGVRNSEFNSSNIHESRLSNNGKKTVKKSSSSCVLTLDDIRSLPLKSLIDKFSEMTSDELTRKYFYKCLLLPDRCEMTFKSFGNEKKACEKIKSHLIGHVQQLISEYEANNNVCNLTFVPRSPTPSSRQTEKISKKKHRISLALSKKALSQKDVFKPPRKEKNTELSDKKLKRKLPSSKKHVAEIKNGVTKDKTKFYSNSVYLQREGCSKDYLDSSYHTKRDLMAKFSEDEEGEFCSNYSKHLKYLIFSNDAAKEKLSESDSELAGDWDEFKSVPEKNNNKSTLTSSSNFEQSYIFLQDHNYVSYEEVRDIKPSSTTVKWEGPYLFARVPDYQRHNVMIRTPPFPYVYIPLLPEVAEIIEIDEVECLCGAEECSRFSKYRSDPSIIKNEIEKMDVDEPMSDSDERYSSAFYKMNGSSSSVLECVDNIVINKPSSSCVPKNEISANENDENVNMQKIERELALNLIAKLHSKGKKKYADSLICQICPDKSFTAQATLIHHYRSHAGIKPYICDICSAKFTRQHSLNYHMLIHQNRSRFTCDFCSRTFRHPSHYKEHLRRHTGETPYHCTDCNLHFKTRNTFKRHLRTRHGKLLTVGGVEDLNNE